MSKPNFDDLDRRAAQAFARDAYRQMTETRQQLESAQSILERMCAEHDAMLREGERCTCTLCIEATKLLPVPSCSVCGFAADAMHEGARYCCRCLAERQAAERAGL